MSVLQNFTPREVVSELDRYIVGQDEAKRAVAIALRNRWRRQQVPEELRDEIAPKNIIMIGPTGVGKTEVARRLAKLAQAPFIKVEASKFTEVGYVGRDVESIIRDLTELGVALVLEEEKRAVRSKADEVAEERLLDALLPPYWSRANPVDLVGERDLDLPGKSLEILMAWDGCDAVINLGILGRRLFLQRLSSAVLQSDPNADPAFLDQAQTVLCEFEHDYIRRIVALMEKYQKPVIGVHLLTDGQEKTIYPVPESKFNGVFYPTPERAVKALSKMAFYMQHLINFDI